MNETESTWHTHRITREEPLPFWRHGGQHMSVPGGAS